MKVSPDFDRSRRVDVLFADWNDRFYHVRAISEQPRPHRKPLPYYRVGGTSKVQRYGSEMALRFPHSNEMAKFSTMATASGLYMTSDDNFTKAHNKALSKVDDQLRTADSFFEDWYERQQAVKLLQNVGKSLFNFVTGWKNPKYWKGIAKKSRPKDLPSAWLAYQFGVKPLVGGVDRAMNLLSVDFPVMKISGSSSDTYDYKLGRLFQVNNYPFNNHETGTALVKIGCEVTGVNPNRALSGATGLNEPFSSVWNVLPWGWAVDYFVNVGQLLGNMENKHPGITVENWYVTRFAKSKVTSEMDYKGLEKQFPGNPAIVDIIRRNYAYSFSGDYYYMRRTVGSAPSYKLEFKAPKLGGNQMANLFAAIALTMSGKKGK